MDEFVGEEAQCCSIFVYHLAAILSTEQNLLIRLEVVDSKKLKDTATECSDFRRSSTWQTHGAVVQNLRVSIS